MNSDQFIPPFKYIDGEKAKASFLSMIAGLDISFPWLTESERKEFARERCLANSTRTRYSRSTLRKTKV